MDELVEVMLDDIDRIKAENEELKKMLKLAVEDLDFIGEYFGCAGCSAAKSWCKCPFNDGKKDCCTDKWRYADKALKLIGDDKNA